MSISNSSPRISNPFYDNNPKCYAPSSKTKNLPQDPKSTALALLPKNMQCDIKSSPSAKPQEDMNIIGHAGNLLVLNGAINLAKDSFTQYGKPAVEFVSNAVHKASQNKHLQKIMNSATDAGKTLLGNEKIHKAIGFTKDHGKNIATTIGAFVSANPVTSLMLVAGAGALGVLAGKLHHNHKENQEKASIS